MTNAEIITLAARYLNASQPRARTQWRYVAEETGVTYIIPRARMLALGRMLRDGVPDAYSHWCAGREVAHRAPRW